MIVKMIKAEPKNSCWLFHRWRTCSDHGATLYQQCKDCGARRAKSFPGGYQPIDHAWVLEALIRTRTKI